MVCAAIFVLVLLGLMASGWWKIHTSISPYVPAALVAVAAILGYVLMVYLY